VSVGARGGAAVTILAPAKINLGLEVVGRRADGYHEIRTLFQTVSLCDRLRLTRAGRGVRVRCEALPELREENLAHRAAELFLENAAPGGGVEILLEKRIPAGGGLGGGSSDAAAALLGCCRLFGVAPDPAQLQAWASSLGSDVPFFLSGGAALGSGRGELVEPMDPWKGPDAALLYLPCSGLSTAAVYGLYARTALTAGAGKTTILLARWREGDLGRLGSAMFNDLETPAFSLAPGLASVKEALVAQGAAGSLLCGSGSSLFGLFEGSAAADRAGRRLRGRFPGRFLRVRFLPARRRWGVVKR